MEQQSRMALSPTSTVFVALLLLFYGGFYKERASKECWRLLVTNRRWFRGINLMTRISQNNIKPTDIHFNILHLSTNQATKQLVNQARNMRNSNFVKIQPRGGELPRPSCEACHRKHNGTYGSGRFCSSSCARSIGGRTHQRNTKSTQVKRHTSSGKCGKMSVKGLLNPM